MKKLLLATIILTSQTMFLNAQDYSSSTDHGEWRYMSSDDYYFLYCVGDGVKNFDEIPDFTIRIHKDEDENIDIRLDAAVVYLHDDSPDDRNYVDIEVIVDRGNVYEYEGKVYAVTNSDKETRVYFDSDDNNYKDLFDEMKRGNYMYVRTTGGGEPIVFKYSLTGFTSGINKLYDAWEDWLDNNEDYNPFERR
tara:strand:- start:2217 stop:2795 length:579 start_codon:yes stop_codon:yes gene_type:complete